MPAHLVVSAIFNGQRERKASVDERAVVSEKLQILPTDALLTHTCYSLWRGLLRGLWLHVTPLPEASLQHMQLQPAVHKGRASETGQRVSHRSGGKGRVSTSPAGEGRLPHPCP